LKPKRIIATLKEWKILSSSYLFFK
jgi:hypothetical protein